MIYKRVAARLKAQDWVAITIELWIVIVGVFIGTQVSNWNESRLEKIETQRMLTQLVPQLRGMSDYFRSARDYYRVSRDYASTAIAGWAGSRSVSDEDFIIAAYQASQITTFGANSSTWATVLGADQLRNIDDQHLRADLSFLMSSDYSQIDAAALDTPYRRNVRRIIPVDIQDAIRDKCGDRPRGDNPLLITLPAKCKLGLAPHRAAAAARLLREHPELRDDLQWHVAAIAAFLANIVPFENAANSVEGELAFRKR